MHRLVIAAALILAACGSTVQPDSQALGSASYAPSATPLPSGVVDPQPLIRQATRFNSSVLRVDDVAAKLVSSADYAEPNSVSTSATTLWVVAVVGEIRQTWGLLPRPNSQCKLSAYRAHNGELWSTREGSLVLCQPYFSRSLTPADAPVRCAPDAYDNGVSSAFNFSATNAGPVRLTTVRDDQWRPRTTVAGAFLAQAPEGSVPYEDAFCLKAFVRPGPAVEKLLASGVGARMPSTLPPQQQAIWLRGYHALSASADATGHIDVVVEPRSGYEWAFFDWHTLVPGGGYAIFRFRDAEGNEILPWRLANGP